jgi:Ca2+-binding EF-hand superfamily protein
LFSKFDTEEPKRELSFAEWSAQIKELRPDINDSDLQAKFDKYDTDNSGTLKLEEFIAEIEDEKK